MRLLFNRIDGETGKIDGNDVPHPERAHHLYEQGPRHVIDETIESFQSLSIPTEPDLKQEMGRHRQDQTCPILRAFLVQPTGVEALPGEDAAISVVDIPLMTGTHFDPEVVRGNGSFHVNATVR